MRSLPSPMKILCCGFAAALVVASPPMHAQSAARAKPLRIPADRPALPAAKATSANIVAATRAGARGRIVAVGDHGVVLLSNDGKTFRQASHVPVQSTLTDVKFLDDQHGWAVGHDGVVLATGDGGERWQLIRRDDKHRKPLLGVWFGSPAHGIAVGQFGEAIETRDGGKTWTPLRTAGEGEPFEQHLNGIAGTADGRIVIVGERGLIWSSVDGGSHWKEQSTGQTGSLWNVLALRDGRFVAAGMRGHLYVGSPEGQPWRRVVSDVQESLTGLAQLDDDSIVVVGFGGTVLTSRDGGASFVPSIRPDRLPLTAVTGAPKGPIYFSIIGLVPSD